MQVRVFYVWILFCTDALIYLNFLHICVEDVESYYWSVIADSRPCFSFLFLCFPDVACGDRWQETQQAGKKAAQPYHHGNVCISPPIPSRLSLWAGCAVQDYSGLNCDVYLQYSQQKKKIVLGRHFLNWNAQYHFYATGQTYLCPEFETITGLIVRGKKLHFQEYNSQRKKRKHLVCSSLNVHFFLKFLIKERNDSIFRSNKSTFYAKKKNKTTKAD